MPKLDSLESEADINSSPLYKNRDEWADVQPIYMNAAESAIVRISHTENFVDAFAYFRAILHRNELSDRAFELTTTCSQLNPANYSVWQFRRNILKALKADLDPEFKFSEEMIVENPKNYQIWHHRRMLVEWTKDPSRELLFTESVLQLDAKNYHAWQHRQFVIEKYEMFHVDELDYSFRLLAEDLRNNSVWNYRYFIVQNLSRGFADRKLVDSEIEFVKAAILKCSRNESSWSYLNGLLVSDGLDQHSDVLEFCYRLHQKEVPSTHLRCFLLDHHKEQLEKSKNMAANGAAALKLIEELVNSDPVRRAFYEYCRDHVNNLLARQ